MISSRTCHGRTKKRPQESDSGLQHQSSRMTESIDRQQHANLKLGAQAASGAVASQKRNRPSSYTDMYRSPNCENFLVLGAGSGEDCKNWSTFAVTI